MARLLIVEDHRTFAEWLAHALSEMGHEVVGDCWMAHQVLPAAETDHDVVLMRLDLSSDINASPPVGLALTEALLERDRNERVLLYAHVEGQEYVDRARRVGAAGYLSEAEMSLPELQEAIETVAAGGQFWPE
jgi:DNA-binding NarL/FixJ family response regulator